MGHFPLSILIITNELAGEEKADLYYTNSSLWGNDSRRYSFHSVNIPSNRSGVNLEDFINSLTGG